jgi:hypothetical protein
MGTVVGAIALLFLCSQRNEIQSILPGTPVTTITPETPRLLLFAVYGLIYCYIASAPILVFHAGRFLLNPDMSKKRLGQLALAYSILPVLCGLAACCASVHYRIQGKILFSLTASALALLLELEAISVYFCIARNQLLFAFYDRLDKRRAKSEKGEIVDSYRHLREHGNSFFIVLLEISLAVVLFEIQKLVPAGSSVPVTAPWLALLVVWIMPAVCIWLISTIFERRFSEAHSDSKNP